MEYVFSERKYEQPRLDIEKFCMGLLSALRLADVTHIQTLHDQHQQRFHRVAHRVQVLREQPDHAPATERLPTLFPLPITGTYEAFNTALIDLQSIGVTHCKGPWFHEVEICLTPEWSQDILGRFREAEQALFHQLAEHFLADATDDTRSITL